MSAYQVDYKTIGRVLKAISNDWAQRLSKNA